MAQRNESNNLRTTTLLATIQGVGVAGILGLTFGEDWRPSQEDIPRYHGPEVVPPRYGPPADYQRAHLPNDFIPQFPQDAYLGALGVLHQQQQQRTWLPLPQYVPSPRYAPPQGNLAHYNQYLPSQPYRQARAPIATPSQDLPAPSRERPNPEVRPGGMRSNLITDC